MRKMFYALLLHFIYHANARKKKMILISLCLSILLMTSLTGFAISKAINYFQNNNSIYGLKSFSDGCKTEANDLLKMGLKLRTRRIMEQSREVWSKCV
jgi:hypothetical protein